MKNFALASLMTSFLLISSVWADGPLDCSKESHFPEISKAELKDVVDKKSGLIIDVNSTKSFAESHVPGAIHFESHKKDFAKQLPGEKSALIVAYCGGPQCNAWKKAAQKACEMGYSNIRHFKAGIKGWKAAT